MLPDFVSLKRELCQKGDDSLRSRFDKDPIFSLIATYRHHEGNRFTIVRADGSHETKHYRQYKAEFTVNLLEVQARGEEVIRQAVDAAETEMIASTKKMMFEEMSATITSVGNSIDAKGQLNPRHTGCRKGHCH